MPAAVIPFIRSLIRQMRDFVKPDPALTGIGEVKYNAGTGKFFVDGLTAALTGYSTVANYDFENPTPADDLTTLNADMTLSEGGPTFSGGTIVASGTGCGHVADGARNDWDRWLSRTGNLTLTLITPSDYAGGVFGVFGKITTNGENTAALKYYLDANYDPGNESGTWWRFGLQTPSQEDLFYWPCTLGADESHVISLRSSDGTDFELLIDGSSQGVIEGGNVDGSTWDANGSFRTLSDSDLNRPAPAGVALGNLTLSYNVSL